MFHKTNGTKEKVNYDLAPNHPNSFIADKRFNLYFNKYFHVVIFHFNSDDQNNSFQFSEFFAYGKF